MKATLLIFFLAFVFNAKAQEKEKAKPLEALSYLEGSWNAPDSILAKLPHMEGRAFFKFELDQNQTHMKILEGFSLTDKNDYHYIGQIYPNPLTGTFDFMGSNLVENFLFVGQYKDVTENGLTREYEVYYPAESQMAKALGQVIEFREYLIFDNKDQFTLDIKYYNKKSRRWEGWSNGRFTLKRIKS